MRRLQGQVMFSDSGDRIAVAQLEQMVEGAYVELGTFDKNREAGERLELWRDVAFVGDSVPTDSTRTKDVFRVRAALAPPTLPALTFP